MAEYDKQSISSEDTNLVFEEKVRILFQTCDINDDGYIDSNDLLAVCNKLNLHLDYSLGELLKELGADETGRISYEEFLRRRLALKPEIEALQNSDEPHNSQEYLFTSSSTSLEGAFGVRDKWEYDSGARDLSPEPNTLQRLVEAAGGSVTTSNAASLLNLANKLHLAALTSLREEINSLTCKLKAVTEERDELLFKMTKNQSYNDESIIESYEERITELHSVIAELSRKVDRQCSLVIEEEVLSEAETSIENSSEAGFPITIPERNNPIQTSVDEDDTVRQELNALQLSKVKLKEQLVTSEEELKATKSVITSFRQKLREINQFVSNPEKELEFIEFLPASDANIINRMDEIELELVSQKIKRLEADNTVLQLSLQESKDHCERLTLLLGKYESNMTALKFALNSVEQALDIYEKLDELLSSSIPSASKSQEEVQLRDQLRVFYSEKERLCDTIVELESYVDAVSTPPNVTEKSPSIDLETAVLVQEVMREREVRGEVKGRLMMMQRERDNLKLALKAMEKKQQELLARINIYEHQNKGQESRKCQTAESILNEELSKSLECQSKLTMQLKNANSALLQSLEKQKTRSQAKLHRMETQMLDMVEQHASQIRALTKRIYHLEEALSNCQIHCSDLDPSL